MDCPTVLEHVCGLKEIPHTGGGVRRATPLDHPQLAGFDWVIRPLLGLSFPMCEVDAASQPVSHFPSHVGLALPSLGPRRFCR